MFKKIKSYWFFFAAVWVGSAFIKKLAESYKDSKQYEWGIDEDGLPALYRKRKQ